MCASSIVNTIDHGFPTSPGYPARRVVLRSLALALFAILASAAVARADPQAAWHTLAKGGAVALIRHAEAPGVGEPPGFKLEDCATQRNLSEKGKADAVAIGRAFRERGIAFQTVMSSPWCRCVDTAKLIDMGAFVIEPAFANAYILSDQRERLKREGLAVLAAWKGPGNLLVATHGANILAMTGVSPGSGEIVVVDIGPDGTVRRQGVIPPPSATAPPAVLR